MKLIKREEIEKPDTVYNLHIENDHNYIVENQIVVSNCHMAKSQSIKGILEKMTSCPRKVGLTGTLDGTKTHKIVIEGLTGKVHKVISTSELIEKNLLSDLKIKCLLISHNDEDRRNCRGKRYVEEIEFLVSNNKRNEFLCDLCVNLKGNTLMLFQYVEKHGKILRDIIEKKLEGTSRKVFYVSGETEAEIRESVRQLMDTSNISLYFGNNCITVSPQEPVLLTNGKYKNACDITTEDDIDNDWIIKNTK